MFKLSFRNCCFRFELDIDLTGCTFRARFTPSRVYFSCRGRISTKAFSRVVITTTQKSKAATFFSHGSGLSGPAAGQINLQNLSSVLTCKTSVFKIIGKFMCININFLTIH